jgi:peptidoglycan hydrolase-like protein with peptidoglycan-binding domain
MTWRIAKSLLKLREQINTAFPDRLRISDGGIGDAAHASRNSDHNPWVRDSKGQPIVTAIDITHDPDFNGIDCHRLAEALSKSADPRIKYLIWDRKITTRMSGGGFGWKKYNGSNPHTQHLHISVIDREFLFDSDKSWNIGSALTPNSAKPAAPKVRDLKSGDQGADVQSLQRRLASLGYLQPNDADGFFGTKTRSAVMFFQKEAGLRADGIVGNNTRRALMLDVKDEEIKLEIPTVSAASPTSTGNLAINPTVDPANSSATQPPNPPVEMDEGERPANYKEIQYANAQPELVTPVIQAKAEETKPDEGIAAKAATAYDWVSGRILALPPAIGAAILGFWNWMKSADATLTIAFFSASGIIGITYLILYMHRKNKKLMNEHELAKEQEITKRQREQQAHEITKIQMESAMRRDLNTVAVVPKPLENSDSPDTENLGVPAQQFRQMRFLGEYK